MAPFEVLAIAASLAATSAGAAPVPFGANEQLTLPGGNDPNSSHDSRARSYQCLGTDISNHPRKETWLSFDELWSINRESILHANNGDTYAQHYIHESILKVADESDLDARWILVVLMQDSQGDITYDCLGYGPRCATSTSPTHPGRLRSRESILASLRRAVRGIREFVSSCDARTLARGSAYRMDYLAEVSNRLMGWDGSGAGSRGCIVDR